MFFLVLGLPVFAISVVWWVWLCCQSVSPFPRLFPGGHAHTIYVVAEVLLGWVGLGTAGREMKTK